jgi:MoaA/NifB/PqqE/SkfB family radical SAM enzyme
LKTNDVLSAWWRILSGYRPALSIEITKECPLSCPGCYAFSPEHLDGVPLTSVADSAGSELVESVLSLIEEKRPLVVYFVGGEPLVRFRELNEILPRVTAQGIEARVVTSAVRPIPVEWAGLDKLHVVVSIDGLQPEHDARRKPATYERILKHIRGHQIVVHCTITSQTMQRPGYLDEFVEFWGGREDVRGIEISLFTPQVGETSPEILTREMRERAVETLRRLEPMQPKLVVNERILDAYLNPPSNPSECIFARITECVSPDLETVVEPCQFGGTPDCSNCGCLGSVAMHAVGEYRLPVGVSLGSLFQISDKVGRAARRLRSGASPARSAAAPPRVDVPEISR